jgi:transglutaminase-like putative cysteine protease
VAKIAWLALLAVPCAHAGVDWKPVAAEELSLKAPRVDKDAPAEILSKEIRIEFKSDGVHLSEYARIKVFTDPGREQATVSVPYFDKDKIREASGRTTKPNGSTQELAKDALFDRTVVKASGYKVKVASFALPNVEAGDVIEYSWRAKNELRKYERLEIQDEIPSERVRVMFKNSVAGIQVDWVYLNLPKPDQHASQETSFEFENLPGIHQEPLMPPEESAYGWMLFICRGEYQPPYIQSDFLQKQLKTSGNLRRAALEITGKASSDEERLRNLYEYCQHRIRKAGEDPGTEDIAHRKENRDPDDTLKAGTGTGLDIDSLFVALARAAGFDARWAILPDGGQVIYDENTMQDPYFRRAYDVGVVFGSHWRFFDPATHQLPFGALRWEEEGQPATLIDERGPKVEWARTPVTPAAFSASKHFGRLQLAADGTLEGDVHIGYTGHFALEKRRKITEQGEREWEKTFSDDIRNRWKGAEVSDLRIGQRDNLDKPLLVLLHLRVPGYASRTGKRLFLQPALFRAGVPPVFTAKTRHQPVYFHYSWSEDDQYIFDLPAGYTLESADTPAPIVTNGISLKYEVHAGVLGSSQLTYRRTLSLGNGGHMVVPIEEYTGLKTVMDAVQQSDDHTLALKQAAQEVAR